MKELQKGIFITDDDKEVLSIIEMLKKQRVKVPEFDLTKDQLFPLVYYQNGFNLYIIIYYSKEGDSGYSAFHLKNFLSENKFNVKIFESYGFDIMNLLLNILNQITGIMKKIDYPFSISTVFDEKFIGIIATLKHPIVEITNSDGHKN